MVVNVYDHKQIFLIEAKCVSTTIINGNFIYMTFNYWSILSIFIAFLHMHGQDQM